jgi:hypothetical protein
MAGHKETGSKISMEEYMISRHCYHIKPVPNRSKEWGNAFIIWWQLAPQTADVRRWNDDGFHSQVGLSILLLIRGQGVIEK